MCSEAGAKIHVQLLRILEREESDSKLNGMIEEVAVAVTTSLSNSSHNSNSFCNV